MNLLLLCTLFISTFGRLNSIEKKVCPFVDFRGVSKHCGNIGGVLKYELISYNTLTGVNGYPVVDVNATNSANIWTGNEVKCNHYVFKNVDEIYQRFYNLEDVTSSTLNYFNGMFLKNNEKTVINSLEQFATQEKNQLFTTNQRTYTYKKVSVPEKDAKILPEVQNVIDNFLTEKYDEEVYKQFVDYFGTHTSISCEFGGLIEQDLFVSSCEKMTKFAGTFDKDLCTDITQFSSNPTTNARGGSTDYQRSTSIRQNEIVGGNPLLSNQNEYAERIKTFSKNPVATKCVMKPIHTFIKNEKKKNNLKQYITKAAAKKKEERKKTFTDLRNKQMIPVVLHTIAPGHGYEYAIGVPGMKAGGGEFSLNFDYSYHMANHRPSPTEKDEISDQFLTEEEFLELSNPRLSDKYNEISKQLNLTMFFNSTIEGNRRSLGKWREDGHGTITFHCKCKADRSCACWMAGFMDKGVLKYTDFKKVCYNNYGKIIGPDTAKYVKAGQTAAGCLFDLSMLIRYSHGYPPEKIPAGISLIKAHVGCEKLDYNNGSPKCVCQLA